MCNGKSKQNKLRLKTENAQIKPELPKTSSYHFKSNLKPIRFKIEALILHYNHSS